MTALLARDRLPDDLPRNPLPLAETWFAEAKELSQQRNPDAMVLVTVNDHAQPSARVVLCKRFVTEPGYLLFFTNYESHKSRELSLNPRVACVMHWDALGRQLRIEGQALRSPASESDDYFATRSWGSQLGAWGSDQSRPVASHDALIAQIRERADSLGIKLADNTHTLSSETVPVIARPAHWGGIRIWIEALEMWVEGGDRIHDRARWTRSLSPSSAHAFATGEWHGQRLQP